MRFLLVFIVVLYIGCVAALAQGGGVVSIGVNPSGNLELAPAPTIHVIGSDGRIRPAPDGIHEATGDKKVRTKDGRLVR